VRRLVTGVSASLALLEEAIARGADAVLVHHGWFWRGEDPRVVGMRRRRLARRIAERLGRAPLHVAGGPARVRTVAWCSGAAQGWIEAAAALGVDAYVTGEISEPTVHVARECGLHFFAAGHHATERDGVRALGEHLAARFGLEHEFVDIPSPA